MSKLIPDYIFTGQYLLPDNQQQNVVKNGGIAVKHDTIIAVGSQQDLLDNYPEANLIHEEHGLIMPGLINTHTHAAMSGFRGLANELRLKVLLKNGLSHMETRLTPELVYQATLLSIAEMIKSGTTSFCDMFLFARSVAQAADKSGIRSWVGEILYDSHSPSYDETENSFSCAKDLFGEYDSTPLVTITAAPHCISTCAPKLLSRLGTLANDNNCLFTIQLLQNQTEVNTCFERYGSRPVQHLESLGLLGSTTLASHCVKLSQEDMRILKNHDVKVSHCIESDMRSAAGIAPAVEILRNGITLSIGTGGCARNNVDMFSEMNSVAKLHKVECMDPKVMGAEETLKSATIGGAAALGVSRHLGSLEIGKKADFIVLDLDQPHMIPMYSIPSHLTYVARGGDVLHSFVNGTQLMKNRELLTLDEESLLHNMTAFQE